MPNPSVNILHACLTVGVMESTAKIKGSLGILGFTVIVKITPLSPCNSHTEVSLRLEGGRCHKMLTPIY